MLPLERIKYTIPPARWSSCIKYRDSECTPSLRILFHKFIACLTLPSAQQKLFVLSVDQTKYFSFQVPLTRKLWSCSSSHGIQW
ncbi:hypothetical protein MKW98_002774 [Papaver atlanticum]|uniref:Uncharacterized protein n=1 Tax=Papaver atlanticum TaxID=357466 RepID=A0AAD4THT2_9MAGN|nr:hypothetical protein MKW98_002774 [Papaver atlanticum]